MAITTPSTSQKRDLLSLPREIRDIISQLSLTEPEGLYCRKPPYVPKYRLYTDTYCVTEANKLKYVCKQLYAETAGLEILFNDVTFPRTPAASNDPDPHVVGSFLSFWASVRPKWHSRKLTFVIQKPTSSDAPGPEESMRASLPEEDSKPLIQICRQFPNVTIKLDVPFFDYSASGIFISQPS